MAKYVFKNPDGPDPSNGGIRRPNIHLHTGGGKLYGANLHKATTPKGGRASIRQGLSNLVKRR
jgi:hypothetical protein